MSHGSTALSARFAYGGTTVTRTRMRIYSHTITRMADMNSHELARVLLAGPDLPVALVSMGYTYCSDEHCFTHGDMQVKVLHVWSKDREHVVIGHMLYEFRLKKEE